MQSPRLGSAGVNTVGNTSPNGPHISDAPGPALATQHTLPSERRAHWRSPAALHGYLAVQAISVSGYLVHAGSSRPLARLSISGKRCTPRTPWLVLGLGLGLGLVLGSGAEVGLGLGLGLGSGSEARARAGVRVRVRVGVKGVPRRPARRRWPCLDRV